MVTFRHRSVIGFAILAALLAFGSTSVFATIRPPVWVNIVTEELPVIGQEMTVSVIIRGANFQSARFDLLVAPPDWKYVAGDVTWTGALRAGDTVRIEARVIPQVRTQSRYVVG
jgi:hypothetical protein